MNDRTLLELAARAAGYAVDCGFADCPLIYGEDAGMDGPREWNPLTDDGDALRLAVKLGLTVDIDLDESWTEIDYTADYQDKEIREGHGGGTDPYGATRRAIVRAAAEIGTSMGGGE
ncbi:hypothetical protein RMH76_04665 [Pseudomonas aeruginosa]|uniref:hypothetical protein n=1 Tax=Pseudomonas aeruginosa TaxID=287 RepID=UPI001D4003BB|nr:hypothetical protein [Pseudomonas aeruginosa]MBN0058909.1 hypothetical protein [Pseudomonas aeruginosa]MDS9482541.1 hypothetical protein [Pseudomonas aeruginosa]MDS9536239.1 hypothetical protein [Pseudomonas aeruginosa]MDS9555906.1 hypothetical protein [Pseudomonas aeruginosa]MDS9569224.1 hypothetical protein [Pseudomonas aeruginosa]